LKVNWKSATTVLLIAVFIVVRFAVRATECLDGNEIFSLQVARQSWGQVWAASALGDSHPPLFHALLKVWIGVGVESLTWLRLLPTLFAIAALIPLWGFCRTFGIRDEERNLTLALMSLNGYFLFYSSDLRMFSLLQFASLCSLWAFACWLHSPSKGWWTSIALLAADTFVIYSHYWGWVLVGCEGLYLLAFARRSVPKFSLITCILAIAYIPWVIVVVHAAAIKGSYTSQISWISPPKASNLFWFYGALDGLLPFRHSTALGLALFGVPVILWAWAAIKHRERFEAFQFLMWFAILPVILTFIASRVFPQSVWADRSLIICAVPYLMLVSVAACRLPGKAGIAVPLHFVAWAVISGVLYLWQPHRLHWDSLATHIARSEPGTHAPVQIFTVEDFPAHPLSFYITEQGTTNSLKIEHVDPKELTHVNGQHFWIVYREFSGTKWLLDGPPEDIFSNQGYRVGGVVQIGDDYQKIRAVPVWRDSVR